MTYDLAGYAMPLRLFMERDEVRDYDALEVLRTCFENYNLEEWGTFLREMTEVCLTTENAEFAEPEQRANLLQQGRDMKVLLEAAWQLADRAGGGKKGPNA